jgi:valyl-tRNA synthetase
VAWQAPAIEARIAFLQDVVRSIRDIRSKYTIPPQARVAVRIRATDEVAASLRATMDLLRTMAGLESVDVAPDVQRTPDAATAIVGPVEVYVLGVVDVEKERVRLTKQRDQLLSRIDGSQRKLANDNFLRKASAEVVQKERARLAESEAEMAHVEATLAALEA